MGVTESQRLTGQCRSASVLSDWLDESLEVRHCYLLVLLLMRQQETPGFYLFVCFFYSGLLEVSPAASLQRLCQAAGGSVSLEHQGRVETSELSGGVAPSGDCDCFMAAPCI